MGKDTCEVCGYVSRLGAVQEHYVIPSEISQQALIPKPRKIRICSNCQQELEAWNSAKITKLVYDSIMQLFRPKNPVEMAEEYQSVFNSYVNYKKRQTKK